MDFFNGKMSIPFPSTFEPMPTEQVVFLYPYQNKPQIILKDSQRLRWCTLSLLEEQTLTTGQVESAITAVSQVITGLYPASLIDAFQILALPDGNLGYFIFQTAGEEGDLHHMMFVFPVYDVMLLGTVSWQADQECDKEELMQMVASLALPQKRR